MNMKRMLCLALAVLMLSLALCGCQEQQQEQPAGNANYKITVIGADGNPVGAGIVAVRFKQDGVQKAMQIVGADGTATKELPKGDYQVELSFTSDDTVYTYDLADMTLSATKTELQVDLYNIQPDRFRTMNVKIGEGQMREYPGYDVAAGRTRVALTEGDRSFFIFAPTESGIYEVSFTGDISSIGHYGAPFFVQERNVGEFVEGKENVLKLTVMPSQIGQGETGTGEWVIGIDGAAGVAGGILNIIRVGDYVEAVPWTSYQSVCSKEQYTLPEGAVVKDIDMLADNNVVLNPEDGFYHLGDANGPLVLVRLGEKSDDGCRYLLDSWESLASTSWIVTYHYDEEGNLSKKINYSACILQYFELDDEQTGLYPLNEDLKTIIMDMGEYMGWWDPTGPNYLFYERDNASAVQIPIKLDNGWLFNCCYIEE